MPALTAKEQRRKAQLAERKEQKKLAKVLKQQGLPLPGSHAAAAASAPGGGGGMSLAGFPGAGCVSLAGSSGLSNGG